MTKNDAMCCQYEEMITEEEICVPQLSDNSTASFNLRNLFLKKKKMKQRKRLLIHKDKYI